MLSSKIGSSVDGVIACRIKKILILMKLNMQFLRIMIYKSGGSTLKDDKRGMRLMLDYFSEYFTEEQLQSNMQRYNVENMLAIVKDYFFKEFGYISGNVELNNQYQGTINSYIYNDKKNPAVVHIDELFESTMMAFFLAMFKWSKNFDNPEVYGKSYLYVLF